MRSTVVQGAPTLFTAVYDGNEVALAWTPSLAATGGYALALAQSNMPTPPIAQATAADPTSGIGALPFSTTSADANAGNWLASVGVGSNITSNKLTLPQWVAGQANSQLPALTSAIRHPDGSISVAWNPASATDPQPQFQINRYRVALWGANGAIASVDVAGPKAAAALLAPGTALYAVANLQLRIMGLNSTNGGVATPVIAVVYEPATILAASVAEGVATIVWQQSRDPQVSTYVPAVYALEDGFASATFGASTSGSSGSVTLPSLDPTKHYVATVIANGSDLSQVAGYRSDDEALLTQAPSLTLLTLDTDRVSIGWSFASNTEDASRIATRVELLNAAGQVVFANDSASNGGVFEIPRIDGGFDIRLTPIGARGVGPALRFAAPIDTVQGLSIQTAAASATSALQWSTAVSSAGFSLRWRPDQPAVSLPAGSTSTPLSNDQQSDPALAPSIRLVTSIGAASVFGPAVQVGALPPAPAALDSAFDGSTLSAAWDAVDGASGYQLTVYEGNSVYAGWPIVVSAATLEWSGAFTPPAGDYQLAVQAVRNGAVGLPQTVEIFESGLFIGATSGTNAIGYSYPASSMAATMPVAQGPAGESIELWLPQLNTTGVPLSVSVGAFQLVANPAGGSAFPNSLKIAAGSAPWQFDGSAIRSSLQLDYQNFLIQAEQAGASPYGIFVLQDAIARHMPQTFAESLYYAFGFAIPSASLKTPQTRFELRPGMLLSVSSANLQKPAASGGDTLTNGYALTAATHFDIQSYAGSDFLPGLDGFISQLAALGVLTVNAPTQTGTTSAGIAAAADSYFSAFAQNFWCVLVPKTLQSASGAESSQWVQQFVLASSATYASLTTIKAPPGSTPAVYFRARSVLTPSLRVQVNGSERIVAVGTTVGNVLASLGRRPGAAAQATSIRLLRGLGLARPAAAIAQSAQPLRFDWRGIASWGLAQDSFDVPLLPGDALEVT